MRGPIAALAASFLACAAPLAAASAGDACGRPSAFDAAATRAFQEVAAALARTGPSRLRIVCLGSSSTAGVGATSPGRAYPARLAGILAERLPRGRGVEVVNRGVGGETVADNLRRLDRDVLALRPDLVIWQVGSNDALRGLPAELVRAQLHDGIARIRALGAGVVLMDPQPLQGPERERVAAMSASIGQVARETGVPMFPRHALLRDRLASGELTPASLYAPDGLHMSDRGHGCVAEALADALAPPAPAVASAGPDRRVP